MPETKSIDSEEPVAGIADNPVIKKGPILVGDDDPTLCLLCTKILGTRGMEVETANDGEEAIRKVTSGSSSSDLKLRGMDGIECLKRLRGENCR
tara:strand:+ start:218 stop:499 length:282 start_codon:yes stop_codon:yes gene_type:complete